MIHRQNDLKTNHNYSVKSIKFYVFFLEAYFYTALNFRVFVNNLTKIANSIFVYLNRQAIIELLKHN